MNETSEYVWIQLGCRYVWEKSLPLLLFLLHCHCLRFERWKNTITWYIFFLLVQLLDSKCQMKSICVRCFGRGTSHTWWQLSPEPFFPQRLGCQYNFARREQERCTVLVEGGKYSYGLRWITARCQRKKWEPEWEGGREYKEAKRTGATTGREGGWRWREGD